ncbi:MULTISPECIES: hydroxymethylglutaryl-CoA reductase, degradative [Croceibacter]|uniref:hydroxymethylglutaryl-CoA reductase, degradative n=1 Tax=Croceibacter TaxID=216431 RepID=UPI000C55E867|nr:MULTISPECIES: hydroxymethylglutaryl-CoA reductase, degradative [Croceibacter]MBG25439.1 hydroxymethylglutaryl-CoA reductase, degradative [Croceibacter sp.]|tara:strand:+ start:8449 stop:9759 length:1311 start_codon:yes stop_codon:yes gene_type:complete
MSKTITGFSKLSKEEKIDWLVTTFFEKSSSAVHILKQYWNTNQQLQQLHDEFTENTISNYYLPFGVAPNFSINGKNYAIPMAIEESSVIAAASNAAKFWLNRGGFKAEVLDTQKVGQVHFTFQGNAEILKSFFSEVKPKLLASVAALTKNMEKRGGGVLDISLVNKTDALHGYYQLHCTFETVDSMGANFINSCLEQFAETFKTEASSYAAFNEELPHIVMSILSNYVPNCIVRAEVSCPVEELSDSKIPDGKEFAEKFIQAINIAEIEPFRAVTHNKGIMNGIDAVVLATGNDFRAVEAGIHAYASKDGQYSSLTHASIDNGIFKFWMEVPLALGTVGGLTSLHPLVKLAMQLLGSPNAKELMKIVAVAGLAQNFAAIKSLTTTGIQQGHMKMHLMNILNQFNATADEKIAMVKHFTTNTVSHSAVVDALETYRS